MSANEEMAEWLKARTAKLESYSTLELPAYIAALQDAQLKTLIQLNKRLENPELNMILGGHAPSRTSPPEYEYKSVTVRSCMLFSDDKEVNKKVAELARYGWELMSNTEARETWAMGNPGRMLQFRREIR